MIEAISKRRAGVARRGRVISVSPLDSAFAALGSSARLTMLEGVAVHAIDRPTLLAAHMGWRTPRVSQQLSVLKNANLLMRCTRLQIDRAGLEAPLEWFRSVCPRLDVPIGETEDPASTYAALSHPLRRHIVWFCRHRGIRVSFGVLERELRSDQASVSKHVAALAEGGLLLKHKVMGELHIVLDPLSVGSAMKPLEKLLAASEASVRDEPTDSDGVGLSR